MTDYELNSVTNSIVYALGDSTMKKIMHRLEYSVIKQVLVLAKGNCDAAAAMLGMNRTTLVEKRRRHGMLIKKISKKK